jgi:hypothetical protein
MILTKKGRFKYYSKWSGNIVKGRYIPRMSKNKGKVNDKTRILPSGYTLKQTWNGLEKAWLGYTIALNKQEEATRRYYASVIQKLQQELVDANVVSAVSMADFPDLELMAYKERNEWKEKLEEDFDFYIPPEQKEWEDSFTLE